ncbi:ATP-binding cassette domain-containing protein [Duganella sp. CY15W]|nr:ABC transporter ATP-binding protein [Duganella sp. CY15W]MYM29464.1 ATP-binding cassette domain-containing protein [Duganella sp. CY15W]
MRLTENRLKAGTGTAQPPLSSFQCFMLLLGKYRAQYMWVTLFAAVVGGGGAMLHPLLLKAIFDAVTVDTDFSRFVYLGAYYLALGLSANLLSYLLSLWQQKLDNQIVAQASENLLRAYFAKNYSEVIRNGNGHYVSRIRSDVKDGLVPMLPLVRRMAVNLVTLAALVSVLVYISWQAFLVLFAIIPIATLVSITVGKKIRGLTNIERDKEAALLDTLTKSVSAFKIIRTFGMIPHSLSVFSGKVDEALESGYRKFRVVNGLQRASDVTMVISDACCIFVGAYFVFNRTMTVGGYIGFMNSFWRSATTLIEIFRQWAELHGHNAIASRLVDFINAHADQPYHTRANAVTAADISYDYDGNHIIKGFSMHVQPGQKVLIAGQNGSGKTTLANILSGYLQPSAGELVLPARINAVTLPLQFPPIVVRALDLDRQLLQRFNLDTPELLDAYPDQLSAGQQQKLALALALSSDAELYILDEPLANLDVSSRALAMQEIQQRTAGRMLVMIMHGADEYAAVFDQIYQLGSVPLRTDTLKAVNS